MCWKEVIPPVRSAYEPTIFAADVTPHRSLDSLGFLAVMLTLGGASLVLAVIFMAAGAWPIVGFLGRVDGFDQDESECESHEGAVVLRGFLAS